jgi:diguanylate cyclase (GGDEF)-like protein
MVNLRYFDGAIAKTRKKFLQLNIAKKMILGFFPLFILTVVMAIYALASLSRVTRINRSIVEVDIPLMKAADQMVDSLISQELHGSTYDILKTTQSLGLWDEAVHAFRTQIQAIQDIPGQDQGSIDQLYALHEEYNEIFRDWFDSLDIDEAEQEAFSLRVADKQEELKEYIQEFFAGRASTAMDEKSKAASLIGVNSSRIFAVFCFVSIILGSAAAFAITRNISGAIIRLKDATQKISEGNFEYTPEIRNQDELWELSLAFSEMALRLKRLEEMFLDTSPLTHLPGGMAIENVLKKRISSGALFAFCLIDLDNFKSYNDYYGYARGNQVLKTTAQIIEKAVEKHGTEDTFVGHIGGDDFIVISPVDLYAKICRFIVKEFDKTIDKLYDPKDLLLGTITLESRTGEEKKYPIMTISIAVVTNKKRKFDHFVEVGEVAAEVKNYAKSKPGSLYCVDRRKSHS